MVSKRLILWLIGGAMLLPIALVIVMALAALLGAMQDEVGRTGLQRVALGLGVIWVLDLIALVLALGIEALDRGDGRLDDER